MAHKRAYSWFEVVTFSAKHIKIPVKTLCMSVWYNQRIILVNHSFQAYYLLSNVGNCKISKRIHNAKKSYKNPTKPKVCQTRPWSWHCTADGHIQFSLPLPEATILNIKSHTMDLLWEKFQWILPLYMKPISFQSKASVVWSVTATIFIDFCLKKLNVFSQHIGQKTNEYLNSAEQIPRNWNVDQLSVLITSWDVTDAESTYCEKS